MQWFKLGH